MKAKPLKVTKSKVMLEKSIGLLIPLFSNKHTLHCLMRQICLILKKYSLDD